MLPPQKKAVLQQWRHSIAGNGPRFMVCFDVTVKPPEIPWSPLVINFDLPRSVEGYALRAAAAVPPGNSRGSQVNGVIVSFVQAAGGDVEMLRSTECAYRFKVGSSALLELVVLLVQLLIARSPPRSRPSSTTSSERPRPASSRRYISLYLISSYPPSRICPVHISFCIIKWHVAVPGSLVCCMHFSQVCITWDDGEEKSRLI